MPAKAVGLAHLVLVAFVVFCTALSALVLSRIDSTIALIWPVNAVIVVTMLWRNNLMNVALTRLAAAVVGMTLANLMLRPGFLSLGFPIANVAECVIVFAALRDMRATITQNPDHTGRLVRNLALAATGPVASAAIAYQVMSMAEGAAPPQFVLQWFLSDLLGLIIFTPAILIATQMRDRFANLTASWAMGAVACGVVAGLGMQFAGAVLAILAAFPLAFCFSVFGGVVAGFGFILSLFTTMVVDGIYLGHPSPVTITGAPTLDLQIIVGAISMSTLLAALVSLAREKANSQRDDALSQLERETRTATALRSAIAEASDAVVLFDAEDRLVDCNAQYRRAYPRSAEAIIPGVRFEDLLRYGLKRGEYAEAIGREEEWLKERLATHRMPTSQMEQRLADGKWILAREFSLEDGGRVGFRIDITERKRLEQDLLDKTERAEAAVRAKDNFLATMSHELRTPMNGVLGMAEAVLHSDLSDAQRKMMGVIVESGSNLMRLLNDLLDFARIETGEMGLEIHPFAPAALVNSQYELFREAAAAKGIHLRVQLGEDMMEPMMADEGRLAQVISNLLSNAIKFTERGEVLLTARLQPARISERAMLEITVEDSGVGVAPDQRARIFDRFEQTEDGKARGGAGLGLSICRAVVEMHRGTIRCRPRPGGGTVFHVSLELDRATESSEAHPLEPIMARETERERSLSILIAEDNAMNQEVFRALLSFWTVDIEFVENGEAAIKAFTTRKFDGVFMDVQMPGMGGVEAIRQIRQYEAMESLESTPVIACSANVLATQIDAYLNAGATGYLAKPIKHEALDAALHDFRAASTRREKPRRPIATAV